MGKQQAKKPVEATAKKPVEVINFDHSKMYKMKGTGMSKHLSLNVEVEVGGEMAALLSSKGLAVCL